VLDEGIGRGVVPLSKWSLSGQFGEREEVAADYCHKKCRKLQMAGKGGSLCNVGALRNKGERSVGRGGALALCGSFKGSGSKKGERTVIHRFCQKGGFGRKSETNLKKDICKPNGGRNRRGGGLKGFPWPRCEDANILFRQKIPKH